MRLIQVSTNVHVLQSDSWSVLFSYETPVAGYHSDSGYFRTMQQHSTTTTKHINDWLRHKPTQGGIMEVPQSWLDNYLIDEGST